MTTPRISVLIATADRPGLLAGCLESLFLSRFTGAEVLVLDQSLREETLPLDYKNDLVVRHLRDDALELLRRVKDQML